MKFILYMKYEAKRNFISWCQQNDSLYATSTNWSNFSKQRTHMLTQARKKKKRLKNDSDYHFLIKFMCGGSVVTNSNVENFVSVSFVNFRGQFHMNL